MGITGPDLRLLEPFIRPGLKMLELGNQRLYIPGDLYDTPAKAHFTKLGVEHTSIDLNGLDGALPLDLRDDLLVGHPEWRSGFDLVTDFGCSEHVDSPGPWPAWKFVYECARTGGAVVQVLPASGNWPKHGYHYVTKQTYWRLEDIGIYRVKHLESFPLCNNTVDGWVIQAVLEKTGAPWPDAARLEDVPVAKS